MDERYRNFEKIVDDLGLLNLEERINILVALGEKLKENDEKREAIFYQSFMQNKWFTVENQKQSIAAICETFLDNEKLRYWVSQYPKIQQISTPMKTIGIVMAGNIPLVGFQDMLCVFVAGHHSAIKLSDKDRLLLPHLVDLMCEIDQRAEQYFSFTERLSDFQGVIATGSNNTARYFEAYFGKYPNIIRKNRNSVSVLDGNETEEDMIALGHDIFDYFGLGCRNVSKIYVPEKYNFDKLLETWHDNFKEMIMHDKYKNNFDYNYALFMLNRIPLMNNGCVILREEKTLSSRIASVHYQYYSDLQSIENELFTIKDDLQCISTNTKLESLKTVEFGKTQKPTLFDYPDDIDIMEWILKGI